MNKIKTALAILLLILLSKMAGAQIQHPVHWAYAVRKLDGGRYEVHLQARIDTGWHIYAQKQLPDAICVPAKITLEKKPGLTLIGIPAEIGKKEKYENKEIGITNFEYAGKVDFVQKVKLAPSIRELKATVTWQACTHKMCLQQESTDIKIPIN